MKKIKLGVYPYTYVRANVMRSLLIKREDYHKLMKMSLNGVTSYLQDSFYKKEIDKFAADYSGIDLLEVALNANLASSFNKLRRISPPELRLLINIYAKRKDIDDIKSIIRVKYTGSGEKDMQKIVFAAGSLDYDFFLNLFRMDSIEEILKKNKIVPFTRLEKAYQTFEKEKTLRDIETELDRYYYEQVFKFTKLLPESGKLFRNFLKSEIEIRNIMTLLRLYREKMDKEEIKKYTLFSGSLVNDLIKSNDQRELIEKIAKSKYKEILKEGIEKFKNEDSLIDIEISLYNYLLNKSVLMLHQHPLSVDSILSYMFAKEIEIKNLRLLTRGKQLGLSEEFIEKQLVVS